MFTSFINWHRVLFTVALFSMSTEIGRGDDETPEIKSILKGFCTDLKSKKVEDRVKAAEAIGELGPKALSACRPLCDAMLDKNAKVQAAAADSLKKVDKTLGDLAVAIYINLSMEAVKQAGLLGPVAEPLCPLIWTMASQICASEKHLGNGDRLLTCLVALAKTSPNDPGANAMIISGISLAQASGIEQNKLALIRSHSTVLIREMKNKKQALRPLLNAAVKDQDAIRVQAIQSLVLIYDVDNDKLITKTLEGMRFDESVPVRNAVDTALQTFKKK